MSLGQTVYNLAYTGKTKQQRLSVFPYWLGHHEQLNPSGFVVLSLSGILLTTQHPFEGPLILMRKASL